MTSNRVFYVKSLITRKILSQDGTWVKYPSSYGARKFLSEEEAREAFPEGISCETMSVKEVSRD